jgi:hypothetical protein
MGAKNDFVSYIDGIGKLDGTGKLPGSAAGFPKDRLSHLKP